jgi:hypothetical protein
VKGPVNANAATCDYSLKQKPQRKYDMISIHPGNISKLDAPVSNSLYAVCSLILLTFTSIDDSCTESIGTVT